MKLKFFPKSMYDAQAITPSVSRRATMVEVLKRICYIFFVVRLLGLSLGASTISTDDSSGQMTCDHLACPAGTTVCIIQKKSTDDLKNISIRYTCSSVTGSSLAEFNETLPNTLGLAVNTMVSSMVGTPNTSVGQPPVIQPVTAPAVAVQPVPVQAVPIQPTVVPIQVAPAPPPPIFVQPPAVQPVLVQPQFTFPPAPPIVDIINALTRAVAIATSPPMPPPFYLPFAMPPPSKICFSHFIQEFS